jgi:hypothetical protein
VKAEEKAEEEEEAEKEVKVMTMKVAEVKAEEEAERKRMNEQANVRDRCIFLPSFTQLIACQPQNQQINNHQSHQISPSIFGRLGYFKRPYFANAWF